MQGEDNSLACNKSDKGTEKGKKRDRSVNYSREEVNLLVTLIEIRKSVIENKRSDAVSNQNKEKAWKAIEQNFNSSGVSEVYRNAKHLKIKYESLKRDVRRKVSADRAKYCGTGSRPSTMPLLTQAEERVLNMILLSVDGDESVSDSDQTTDVFLDHNESADPIGFEDEEPVTKKWCPEQVQPESSPSTSQMVEAETQPILKLVEEKMSVVLSQKKLFEEQIKEKRLQRLILEEELEHNRKMHALQKQEMLLKIEILKSKLIDLQ